MVRGPWLFIVPRVGTIQFDGALVINYVQGGDNTVGRAIVVMGNCYWENPEQHRAAQYCCGYANFQFHFHGNFLDNVYFNFAMSLKDKSDNMSPGALLS